MKNRQAARKIARNAVRLGKTPFYIVSYLMKRFGASQKDAEETEKWARDKES